VAKYKKGDPCPQRGVKPLGPDIDSEPRPIPEWPSKLDFITARRILFPNDLGDDDFPRMDETFGWSQPEFLTTEELAKKGISHPSFEVFLGILQAVKHATVENRRAPGARAAKSALAILKKRSNFRFVDLKKQLVGFQNAISAKRAHLDEFQSAAKNHERSLFGEWDDLFSVGGLWRDHMTPWSDIDDAVKFLMSRVDRLKDREERNSGALDGLIESQYAPGNASKKIEAHIFARYLGFVWFDLTGTKPTKGNKTPFVCFVSDAWDCLISGLSEKSEQSPSWASVCRQAVETIENLQKRSPLFCWERSTLGFLPKYQFSESDPESFGRIIVDDQALYRSSPFDTALLFGRLSTIESSKPDPEFLRLQKSMDIGALSSANLTAEQVNLFQQERLQTRPPLVMLADPRKLTPLELRRREIWRAEALAEWYRIVNNFQLASSLRAAPGLNIKAALNNWRGPAIRRFVNTLSKNEAMSFGVATPDAPPKNEETSPSIFGDLGINPATEAQIENWLKPRSIFSDQD
jgi:hypothetical protein